jgi:hypothetical protein
LWASPWQGKLKHPHDVQERFTVVRQQKISTQACAQAYGRGKICHIGCSGSNVAHARWAGKKNPVSSCLLLASASK